MNLTMLSEAERRPRDLAVGEFDGVHLGHREVILGADAVLTFDPHPRSVVTPERSPLLLTSVEVKADLVEWLGVREVIVVPFDEAVAGWSPEHFVDRVLVDALDARTVRVGANFRFGHRARGTAGLLAADSRFDTRVAGLVEHAGAAISSTRIRARVAEGDVAEARKLLGAPFELRGEVVHGDARGRTLGYPTANLVPAAGLALPAHGVYACQLGVRDNEEWVWRAAATNVGVRPTFASGRGVLVEAHLLDFNGDLYGREIRLAFLERLRGEERFDSVEALVAQMARDVARTRALCGGQPPDDLWTDVSRERPAAG